MANNTETRLTPSITVQHVTLNNSELKIAGRDQIDYDKERRKLADWLSPLNFKASQSEFLQTREQGTGNWLLELPTFQAWRDGTSQTLWCPGNPGAGKTILASIVVNHLQMFFKDRNVGIVFIYCNYKEQATQKVTHLIASLLKQLVQDRPVVSDNMVSFYRYHQNQSTYPTLDEITKALEAEIKAYAGIFIIVDALDECTETGESRIKLLKALQSLAGPVNLMVTSRDIPSIEQHFCDAPRLDIRATEEDVMKYVQSRLAYYSDLVNLQEAITKQIVSNSRGMFLLARLHMNAILEQESEETILDALDHLPNEIDQIYDEAMERIERQPRTKELAKRVLSWIIYATRPLSIKELQHAVAISPKMTAINPRALVFESKLTSVCAGLVVIDKEQYVVRLAHYTTQQYFENQRESRFPNAEASIAATCLTYLSFDLFARGCCNGGDELESLLRDNPFLNYAAQNWGHHARRHQESIKDLAMNFLRDDSKVKCASQVMLLSAGRWSRYSRYITRDFSALHHSAYCGLEQIVRCQLENRVDANEADDYGRAPLSYAAQNGHDAVVRLLLAWGDVEADPEDLYGRTPLLYAASSGHDAIVKLLLAQDDVDADSKDSNGRTPLMYSAQGGHDAVVKLLLARDDVDVNSKDWHGKTPLSRATGEGHHAVVKLLLARDDVEADWKDSYGGTPLSYAADNGHVTIVELLLTRGDVQADSADSYCQTPLSYAANGGHDAVVKLLLAQGDVEVNSKADNGRTPVSYAAGGGYDAVLMLLLARDDFGVDWKDNEGRSPLSYAADEGRDAVVDLLLSRSNVEADSKATNGRTPLSYAAASGHDGVVKLLLTRHDVEVDSKGSHGRTPLSYAAGYGHDAVVKLLLARDDVEVDSKDSYDRTPLSYAADNGHDAVVKLLLAQDGIGVDWKDLHDQTPLSYAAGSGHQGVVKLLLARDDIELDWKDMCDEALSHAINAGHRTTMQLLLSWNRDKGW